MRFVCVNIIYKIQLKSVRTYVIVLSEENILTFI